MKIRVVSSEDEIESLKKGEKIVHLAFRPSNKNIFALIQRCPELEAVHIPASFLKTVSKFTRMLLAMQGISLLEGDIWGHRKDINEYYEIKQEIIDMIRELKTEGMSGYEILKRMERTPGLSKDLLQFLIKEEKKQ